VSNVVFETDDFTWRRPKDPEGFVIETDVFTHDANRPRPPEPWLVQRANQFEFYNPLEEETGLFITFFSTERTPDGVLGFARKYGRLGRDVETTFRPQKLSTTQRIREGEVCESVARWLGNMQELAKLFKIWEMVRREDGKALAEWRRGLSWLAPHLKDDPVEFANFYVAHQFSAIARQLWEPRIVLDSPSARPGPKIVPVSLLGALYLQFAFAVGGSKDYQQCARCGKWFELTPGVNRADRLFCSDACRMASYRERVKQARRLAAEGKTIRQIAKELGVEAESVHKWVAPSKG
jgi:hypothetical protein